MSKRKNRRHDKPAAQFLRLMVPNVWIGLIVGVSFIATPLKFLAEGVTIPIGVAIGRLTFNGMNILELVLALGLLWASLGRGLLRKNTVMVWLITALFGLKVAVIRPILYFESNQALHGNDPGRSDLHTLYVVAEVALLVALVVMAAMTIRSAMRVR